MHLTGRSATREITVFPPDPDGLGRRVALRLTTVLALVAALLAAELPHGAQAATSGGWTTTATISSSDVEPGDSLSVTTSVVADRSQRALVDVEIYSISGDKAHQRVWRRPHFRAGTARTFSTTWTVPSDVAEGDYVVKVGVFDTDWSPLHHWNDSAARFDVTQPDPSKPEPSPTSDPDGIYEPVAGCDEGATVPLGQSPDAVGFEPLGSIWCFNLNSPPAPSAVEGSNSWVDEFDVGGDVMYRFADGDMGYRVFNQAGAASPDRAQHFINQNHWMTDAQGAFHGGTSLRPDRSFRFEDGKLVVEGDFAAAIPEYGNDIWGEITVTTAPQPTGVIADNLYAYGQFGGHWAVGCRLQPSQVPVCAVEGPRPDSPQSGACSAIPGGYRVAELSFWQRCGSDVMGGYSYNGDPWRECERGGMDMACRDRFRMEVTKDSLTLYVNGVKYFEDAGWPATHQLPDSFLSSDVYAYQSNWQVRAGDHAYRYHWDRFAVNPPSGPTASPSFS